MRRNRVGSVGGAVGAIAVVAVIIASLSGHSGARFVNSADANNAFAAPPTNLSVGAVPSTQKENPGLFPRSAPVSNASAHPAIETHHASEPGTNLISIDVSSEYTEPPMNVDRFGCRGFASNAPACSWGVTGVATFTGTIWGNAPFECSSDLPTATPDGKLLYTCSDYVTGGVDGCGTGSFVVEAPYGYLDLAKYDPVTNTVPGFNTWTIRPNSATGTLADHLVSGHGENHWTYFVNGQLGLQRDMGRGHFSGTITCRV